MDSEEPPCQTKEIKARTMPRVRPIPTTLFRHHTIFNARRMILVSVRKVIESYESDVIQGSYRLTEDRTDVDIRKPLFL